ncbi:MULTISPECIES: restriction endonuclease subunit S domain-containing protein [Streptomyces]|uniref:hypothetical protein n=1 Tax=Streptomyces TaxID=1883 RepID=UPI001C8D0B29|nr:MULTISPECIES: hypothetical protein [Streptomyces]UKW29621.1 hypothetical protein MCU78_11500 [Streptomyces sp. TYQ1024]
MSTIGDQFEVQLGKMLDTVKNIGIPKPYIGNRAVQWGRIDLSAVGTVPLTRSDMRRFRLRKGDLLVCEGGEVGRGAIWRDQLLECYYQKALHRLRSKGGYDVRLMLALLEYWASVGVFSNYVTQTSIAHLPRDKFIRMPLPLPSVAEQGRISDAIQDVNDLIFALEQMIAKKQAIKQGMMQQLLTGRTRLPGFNDLWREVCLREEGATYGGLTGKAKKDFDAGSAQFVTFMEVMAGPRLLGHGLGRVTVGPNERQNAVQRGDVLFNGSSETPEEVALAAVVDFSPSPTTFLNSFCFGYRLKRHSRIDPAYLAYFFRSDGGRALVAVLAQGATRYNIAKTKLLDVSPILPPVDEQRAIVATLRDAENAIAVAKRRLVKARAMKTGMVQELLTGRTRLPVKEGAA